MDPRLRERVRNELLAAARRRRRVTYGHLMKKFGISRGHPRGGGISGVIGEIDAIERRFDRPGFAALVVRKDTGYPGGGYFCDDTLRSDLRKPRRKATDPRLTAAQKRFVESEQEKVWRYYGQGK